MTPEEKKRRDFMKQATGLGVLGMAAAAGIYAAPKLIAEEPLLRPPGAVPEEDYLKMCIKCGQCLQVCPYDSILLEDIEGGASVGMAYIDPTQRGCYLCEAFPCILACPTGALDHESDEIDKVHMGMAVIVKEDACLALHNTPVPESAIDRMYDHTKILSAAEHTAHKVIRRGDESEKEDLQKQVLEKLDAFRGGDKQCTMCADLCPFHPDPSTAIGMVAKNGGMIPEIREACVGCGVCVEVCPTEVLQIVPRATYADIYHKGNQHAS
jgi:ferredoxin-type protein NapG